MTDDTWAGLAELFDVGGGAGNQSFPLAQAGYDVTLLPSTSATGSEELIA